MLVVIILAAAVILAGIVVVAMGRGGELARNRPDRPARTDLQTWSDVAGYRPPPALLGYHAGATEHALALIARTIAERDAEIDWLRQRLAELQPERLAGAQPEADAAGLSAAGLFEPQGTAAAAPITTSSSARQAAEPRASEDE